MGPHDVTASAKALLRISNPKPTRSMAPPVRRFLVWILIPPIALVLALFAIANRDNVIISIDPLPFTFALPLHLIVFISLAVGLIAGYLVMWVSGYRTRRDFRKTRRRLATVESELHAIRADHASSADDASMPTVERNVAANDGSKAAQRL